MIYRFLLGAGLGALVGSGLLALASVISPPPPRPGASLPAPAGEPAAMPEPEAVAAPEPVAVPEPVAEPEPVVEPVATPEPAPEPAAEPAPEPLVEVAPMPLPAEIPAETPAEPPAETPAEPTPSQDIAAAPVEDAPEVALAEDPAAPAPDAAEPAPQAPEPAEVPQAAAVPDSPAAPAGDPAPAAVEEPAAAPDLTDGAAPDTLAPPAEAAGQPEAPAEIAAAPASPADPGRPAAPLAETAPAPADLPGPPPAPEPPAPEPPADETAEAAPEPALPEILLPDSEDAPEAAPAAEVADERVLQPGGDGSLLPSTPSLSGKDTGVVENRLPRIGDDATAGAEAEAAEAALPIAAHARPFENPEAKPVFAIVLIDEGQPDLDRAALAALPFPVSFALDPMDPATAERAAIYRGAGQEVVMLATALPKGAEPSDIEVAMEAMGQGLPEAVAVMDPPDRLFQGDRPLASLVVPVIGAQGRGVLSWDQGLNAADQVARRTHVPAAVAFRDLDGEGEAAPVIRRYLDRAAFKAAQEGRVTVVGRTRPETVAALLEWSLEGRAATVALAPLTAAMATE
ncbi:MAG: divergent polysaccharide deacetylase family protein [Paracoccaceae bacterium]